MPHPRTKLPKLAKIAVDALEDLKGQDIKVLDVQKLTTVTDTMIICTGTSNRHVKALAQNVAEDAKKAGHRPLGIEGEEAGEWVLVDLGSVVVHVMQAQPRAFYQLEKLWTVEEPTTAADAQAQPQSSSGKTVAARKTASRSPATKKTAVRKTAAKKPTAKRTQSKTAARKPAH